MIHTEICRELDNMTSDSMSVNESVDKGKIADRLTLDNKN